MYPIAITDEDEDFLDGEFDNYIDYPDGYEYDDFENEEEALWEELEYLDDLSRLTEAGL